MRSQYARNIFERFMSENELAALDRRYNENLTNTGGLTYTPTFEHWSLYREWLQDKLTVEQVAERMNVSQGTVLARFARIAKIDASGKSHENNGSVPSHS